MSCRFPGGADSLSSYWNNILNKVDCIESIPKKRWDQDILQRLDTRLETEFAKVGGFVHDIEEFDAAFFGISPREAIEVDPQQRILLELAWRCMEDAAISVQRLREISTGVYVGVINHDHERLVLSDRDRISAHSGLGRSTSIASNRISYCFDFNGPSLTIDTACSSSLTAVDAACNALRSGEVDAAFAGGANAILLPESYIEFSRASMLSKTGKCRAFDQDADGFVRAEGGGLILLKRLSDALLDGDRIYATIAASVLNQDGRTAGIMSPNLDSQKKMMADALLRAGLDRSDIGYIESHGTGTQVGDTIEAAALGEIYGQADNRRSLPVGSVKTNIGHTEAAAGIAGLIKAALAIWHGYIPPNLNFSTPNPDIDFDCLGIHIPVDGHAWDNIAHCRRIAAVNSFGFGGSNAHVIIQQAPQHAASSKRTLNSPLLLPLTASSPLDLDRLRKRIEQLPDRKIEYFCQLCHTAGRQPQRSYRQAVTLNPDFDNNSIQFKDYTRYGNEIDRNSNSSPSGVAFVFNGIGVGWHQAGQELYSKEPIFRSTIDLCHSIFNELFDISTVRDFFSQKSLHAPSGVVDLHVLQFALQISILELWKTWGVRPVAVVGHSVGEIAAAYVCGSVNLVNAARIVAERAFIFEQFIGKGQMLAVGISEDEAEKLIDSKPDEAHIAAYNSDSSITFSGTSSMIETLAAQLEKQGNFFRTLDLPVPFHSPMIDACQAQILQKLKSVEFAEPNIHWYSSVNGGQIESAVDSTFWWQNFRDPVRFSECMRACITDGITTFVEVGPHPYLSYSIAECLSVEGVDGHCTYSVKRTGEDALTMRSAVASLFNLGFSVDWHKINPIAEICDFPETEFDRTSYRHSSQNPQTAGNNGLQNHTSPPASRLFSTTREISLEVANWDWLNRHKIEGNVIFPAAGYIKYILEAASDHTSAAALELNEIQFMNMLQLPESSNSNHSVNVTVSSELTAGQFNCQIAKPSREDAQQVVCAQANFAASTRNQPSINPKLLSGRITDNLPTDEVIRKLSVLGLEGDYAAWSYTLLAKISDTEAFVKLTREDEFAETQRKLIHPSLLDLCFRTSAILVDMNQLYVPKNIEKLEYWGGNTDSVYCHIKLRSRSERTIEFDLNIADEQGSVIVSVSRLMLKATNIEKANASQPVEHPTVLQPSFAFHHDLSPEQPLFRDETKSILSGSAGYSNRPANLEEMSRCHETVSSLLNDLTVHYIGRTLKQLEFPGVEEQCSLSLTEQICKIDPDQITQFYALLRILEHRKLIDISRKFCPESCDVDANISVVRILQDLPSNPELLLDELFELRDASDYTNEIRLIDLCGRNLGSVLKGCKTGISTLFPDGVANPLQGLYEFSPTCRPSIETLVGSVDRLLANWQLTRTCRILEIGAGTGALLSQLVPTLEKHPVEYTFSDVSRSLMRFAKERFSDLDFLEFQTLDIDANYEIQGISANTYDIVLANDVLHLSRDIQSAVQQIHEILVPGGRFHFVELTTEPGWANLVFGMLRDWWHRTEDSRQPVGPCHRAEFWEDQLALNGFNAIESIGNPSLPHTVFAAECKKDTALVDSVQSVGPPGRALIFSDRHTYSEKFIESLTCQNKSIVRPGTNYSSRNQSYEIQTNKLEDYVRLVEELQNVSGLPQEIILLWDLFPLQSPSPFDKAVDSISSSLVSISYLIRALEQLSLCRPFITFVTANAFQRSDVVDIESCLNSTLWSMGRTIRSEFPETACRLIDIDPRREDLIPQLCQFVQNRTDVLEAVLDQGRWILPIANNPTPQITNHPIEIGCLQPGNLSSIQMIAAAIPKIESNEVLIEVTASALNFRDVMIALNALPEYAVQSGVMQDSLGMECTGKIVKLGSQVEGFSLGDEVVALAPRSMRTLVTARAEFVQPIPEGWSFEQAAGIPTAYITALSCLELLPEIKPDASVLIHTASGGVGLALIHLVKQSGATIYATVGSSEKVEYLNLLGIEHVASSRSTSFVSDVNEWTCAEGVDLIVNTLGGEMAGANAKLLKPAGAFVELGKYRSMHEIHASIRHSNPNASIRVIDIDSLWKESPDVLADLFRSTMKNVEQGKCPALPCTVFSERNAREAFRYMANAKHIGKVILKFERPTLPVDLDSPISSAATYLVAGGTRGFGLATLQWLSELGARHIIAIGRNPNKTDQFQNLTMKLEKSGVSVKTIATDITHLGNLSTSIDELMSGMPPIKGVFHCAMEIEDRMITNLDIVSCETNMKAKILGAWNLYKATEHLQLDFFALYSSVTSMIGPSGQAAYTSANGFLDSFAKFLRAKGIPAISINWGAVSDYGYVADNQEKLVGAIDRYGICPLPAKSMLAPLEGILASNSVSQLIISGGNWPQSFSKSSRLDATRRPADEASNRSGNAKGTSNIDRESCEQIVLSCFSKVLEIPMNSIAPSESILNLGVDSLLAVELSHLLRSEGNFAISATELLQSITISDIVESQTQANN